MFTLELAPGFGASADAKGVARRGVGDWEKKRKQCEEAQSNVSAE